MKKIVGWIAWYLYLWLVVNPWQRHIGYNPRTMEQTEQPHGADYEVCSDWYCRIAQPFDRYYLRHNPTWNLILRWRK